MKVSSLYLHFPFCKHLCNFCDFYKLKIDSSSQKKFISQLYTQHHKFLPFLEKYSISLRPLKTLYVGGGTPSLFTEHLSLKKFFEDAQFSLEAQSQFTVEVDPGGYNAADLGGWCDLGANRASVGIQTLNPQLFPFLDRHYLFEKNLQCLKEVRQIFPQVSADFMIGLPYTQKLGRNIKEELDQVLECGVDHISVYILTPPKTYPLIDHIDEELTCEEFYFVDEYLRDQGFEHYEVSNFARPGRRSLHNKVYWEHESFLAFGPSATGFLNFVPGSKAWRFKWGPLEKESFGEEWLGPKELELEKIYMGLRRSQGIEGSKIPESLAQQWIGQGLATRTSERQLSLTAQGWLKMDSLILQLNL